MKAPAALQSKEGQLLALGIVGALVLYWLVKKLTDFNKGTPYAGTGAVGTLGNVTDQLSGGTLSAFGQWIGDNLPVGGSTGASVYYTVTFPDGARHAVDASTVDGAGYFTFNGVAYTLGMDASGAHVAYAR
jgi:hypothetical protein